MWAEGDCRRNCTWGLKSSISPYLTAPWRLPEFPPLSRAASHILSTSLLPNQRSSLQNKALATCQVLFAINIFLTDTFLRRQHTNVFAYNLVLSALARLLLHCCIHFINAGHVCQRRSARRRSESVPTHRSRRLCSERRRRRRNE